MDTVAACVIYANNMLCTKEKLNTSSIRRSNRLVQLVRFIVVQVIEHVSRTSKRIHKGSWIQQSDVSWPIVILLMAITNAIHTDGSDNRIWGKKSGTSVYHGVSTGSGVRHWNASVSNGSRRIRWATGRPSGKIGSAFYTTRTIGKYRTVRTVPAVGKPTRLKLTWRVGDIRAVCAKPVRPRPDDGGTPIDRWLCRWRRRGVYPLTRRRWRRTDERMDGRTDERTNDGRCAFSYSGRQWVTETDALAHSTR